MQGIDILDGSPPCSTFSSSGTREKRWGREHRFREGQATQTLDDLFFQFIRLAEKLNPRIIIAENVKGLITGNAKGYVLEIDKRLRELDYVVQIFLLNAATMGVPQKRERVFFIARQKKFNLNDIKLDFAVAPILFKDVSDNEDRGDALTPLHIKYWNKAKPGGPVGKFCSNRKVSSLDVASTITAGGAGLYHDRFKRKLNLRELSLVGTYPLDYNFLDVKPKYLIGMSVPPVMMAQISRQIHEQWLSRM